MKAIEDRVTYKYTSEIDEEDGERSDEVKEHCLIDLSEVPVLREACGSDYLSCKGGCVGIPAGVKSFGSKCLPQG